MERIAESRGMTSTSMLSKLTYIDVSSSVPTESDLALTVDEMLSVQPTVVVCTFLLVLQPNSNNASNIKIRVRIIPMS